MYASERFSEKKYKISLFVVKIILRLKHFGKSYVLIIKRPTCILKPRIMEEREKNLKDREDLKLYLEQINWDWLMLKGQLILGGILLVILLGYFLLN